MTSDSVEHPGDIRHPEHEQYLCELGRATYRAARLAGIAFDILRVFDSVPSEDLYEEPLGALIARLDVLHARRSDLPGLTDFIAELGTARTTRNDLIHALPDKNGLLRRTKRDPAYIRNFYTVDDVSAVSDELEAAFLGGCKVLHDDDGAALRAWTEAGGG